MTINDVTVVSPAGLRSGPGKAFYTDALGFELTRDDDSVPGIGWVTMPPALCKDWSYAPMTSTRLPAAACRRRAVRRNPRAAAALGHRGVIHDPGGNMIVLQQARQSHLGRHAALAGQLHLHRIRCGH